MRLLCYILIIISLCCGVIFRKTNSLDLDQFPKALIFHDKPVHPDCVLTTQFGDSSRLLPKLAYSENEVDIKAISITNQILDYSNIDKNIVKYTMDYRYDSDQPNHHAEIWYQAWKVTEDIALVLVNHFDTAGTGRFSDLGLVRREGNYLINSEEIASGDRSHGGHICVDFYKDGMIQYRTAATYHMILKALEQCLPEEFIDSPYNYAGEFIWQCHIQDGKTTKSELIAIEFF